MDLQDGPEGGTGGAFVALLGRGEAGRLHPEREPDARVVVSRDIGGPGPEAGQPLWFVRGEGRSATGERRGGGAGKTVHHRVEERAQ